MIAAVSLYAACGILLALLPLRPCLPIVHENGNVMPRASAPRCRFEVGQTFLELCAAEGCGDNNIYSVSLSTSPRSDKLAFSAGKLAAELSRQQNCNLPLYYRSELGTNYLSAGLDGFSEAVAAQFWYEGHTDYDFENGGPMNRNPNVLSFTQLIWKSSQEVGCGVACCDSRQIVLVCQFNPPGNIQGTPSSSLNERCAGHFTSNVPEKFERLNDIVKEVPYEL
ncbi:SCP-like extracellular family protein, putative [Babesia ovata]|uniref:SCP-like extracellular family protein, putative n=1 Tax=Babesia ovata TaxID=189622 RepID=A0A2H6K8F3_9APIC|nr:SCP-like extracellular family protein, putative [Babesia ovata]GBE59273.1 SCP-like extracellular family protein, putative [Babesia ovata]